MQNILASDTEMEEERRLAYVAITRAKNSLYLIHTQRRMLYGRTTYNPVSRFVEEIPEELIESERRNSFSDERTLPRNYYSQAPKKPVFDEQLTVNRPLFEQKPASDTKSVFKEGDIVSHMTFGRGEILSVKSMGADTLYEVAFDKVGTKKLMATYARLKKL